MMKVTLGTRRPRRSSVAAMATPALAQGEQFLPSLVYRTGPYAPNGIPFANGVADYWTLLNERDGGINGVKMSGRGMRDRLRHRQGRRMLRASEEQGPDRRRLLLAALDRHHLRADREGAGRQDPAADHGLRPLRKPQRRGVRWNFPPIGSYWTAADVAIQHIAKELGGFDKLKGKKISLVYHDSPYGKEPILALEELAKKDGFTFKAIPVTHPGVEQKSQWLAIRQDRPDYVLLWGWGVMNSDRGQGSRGRRLSARQDHRRVVVGRRAGRHAGRRSVHRLQGADAPAWRRQVRGACRPREARARQGQVGVEGRLRPGALQPWPGQLDARHRGDPHRDEEVRQQADDRRAGALGLREPRPHRRAHQGTRLRGYADPAQAVLRDHQGADSAVSSSGTARPGR